MLIINADDIGRSRAETNAALTCFAAARISSGSFMVLMRDSERGADLVQRANLEVGLHLNFTEPFTTPACPPWLQDAQASISGFLRRARYNQLIYHPLLRKRFADSYRSQVDEFGRLFGGGPSHFDGHHHMHLCANLLLSNFIPANARMRPNFSFWPGEKSRLNRLYRRMVDGWLARRYRLPAFFVDLAHSLQNQCLDRALTLARMTSVELMTHPVNSHEAEFLLSDAFLTMLRGLEIASYARL